MSMPTGLDDLAVEKSLREITAATADILAPLMVRIGIYESDPEKIYEGGKCRGRLPPPQLSSTAAPAVAWRPRTC